MLTNYNLNNYSYKGIIVAIDSNVKFDSIDKTTPNKFRMLSDKEDITYADLDMLSQTNLFDKLIKEAQDALRDDTLLSNLINYVRPTVRDFHEVLSDYVALSMAEAGEAVTDMAPEAVTAELRDQAENTYVQKMGDTTILTGKSQERGAQTSSLKERELSGVGFPGSYGYAFLGDEEVWSLSRQEQGELYSKLKNPNGKFHFLYLLTITNLAARDIIEKETDTKKEFYKKFPYNVLVNKNPLMLYAETFVRGCDIFVSKKTQELIFSPNNYLRSMSNKIANDKLMLFHLASFYVHLALGELEEKFEGRLFAKGDDRADRIIGDFLGFKTEAKNSLNAERSKGGNPALAEKLRNMVIKMAKHDNTLAIHLKDNYNVAVQGI
jgi:hypothetical protein